MLILAPKAEYANLPCGRVPTPAAGLFLAGSAPPPFCELTHAASTAKSIKARQRSARNAPKPLGPARIGPALGELGAGLLLRTTREKRATLTDRRFRRLRVIRYLRLKRNANSLDKIRECERVRCYLMRDGHIAAVELLDVKSDEEAVEKCRALFEERKSKFEGFEVWDHARKIAHGPPREDDEHADG